MFSSTVPEMVSIEGKWRWNVEELVLLYLEGFSCEKGEERDRERGGIPLSEEERVN